MFVIVIGDNRSCVFAEEKATRIQLSFRRNEGMDLD